MLNGLVGRVLDCRDQRVASSRLTMGVEAQSVTCLTADLCLRLQIQGSRVRSRPGPILSWRLNMI